MFVYYQNISLAQMPDWTLIIDNDGNRYYLDKNGNIWTSGEPEFDYKPVSIDGLDYYLYQGIELIKSHHKAEGLILLKSILALPADNRIIYDAQVKASKEINKLIRNEGNRFENLNKDASLLLFKNNNHITIINDDMNYSFKCPLTISLTIISKRIRIKNNYKYYGLLLGFRFGDFRSRVKEGYSGYDLLIAIDSERFPHQIKKVKTIEEHWRKRLGHDTLKREIIDKSNTNILYSYKDNISPGYSGIEGFFNKNNSGYYVKAITGREFFEKNKTTIIELIRNFKI